MYKMKNSSGQKVNYVEYLILRLEIGYWRLEIGDWINSESI